MPGRRPLLTALAAAVVAVAGSLPIVPPAQAATPSYVALGDSYSSGEGTRHYLVDGTDCDRSTYAYPSLLAAAKGYALNFRACSGATVADVARDQLGALAASTRYVTISVGGNDARFSHVITECALPAWASNCRGAVSGAQHYIRTALPGSLSTLYASIRVKAPNATVVVVGYPKLFMGADCNALTWFSPKDEQLLNDTAVLLDDTIAAAAAAKAFAFVNPIDAFTGHAVCDHAEWINGLSHPVAESFHPNRAGQGSGYAPLVSTSLTGTAVRVTPRLERTAAAAAGTLAAQQRRYAAADARIEPEVVRLPTRAELGRPARQQG
jgi:lysophospholipase L1-like esterase